MVEILDKAADGPVTPLAFSTTALTDIRAELHKSKCPLIDFFDLHMTRVESILGVRGMRVAARLHGMGDVQRYNARMAAVEYAIEHDDGQSMRALDKADVILLAPSRCGKTPTTMYLALQHGIFVANYPLVEEDFESGDLPRPVAGLRDKCFGLTTNPARLSQVRQRAPTQLPICLARAVQLRAAAGRSPVPQPPHPGDRLLRQVGGGDGHRDLAAPHPKESMMSSTVAWFAELGLADLEQVGGKNSSLGEMISNLSSAGVRVPDGFATTAEAYRRFLGETGLADRIAAELADLEVEDTRRLAEVGAADPVPRSSRSRSRPIWRPTSGRRTRS